MSEHPRGSSRGERRRALREVRDAMQPSPELEARLQHALNEASLMPRPARTNCKRRLWMQAPVMLPAALGVVIALYATLDTPSLSELNVAEHSLEIPQAGRASITLDLALHHHGDDWADVAVHAPRNVSVSTRAVAKAEPATCRGNRCRYEFSHKGNSGSPGMQVHVSHPGRYRMEIEHSSPSARVREVVVIHALR